MPTVRFLIRNEYGMADPEVYRAAERDDPEALLEGVAMAGLVGVLRQLGDLAEFAAEVFYDLHEEVMTTSSRGHGLILRVQQLEAEFPLIEKAILSQTDHSHCAYSAGIDWHPNLRVEQNLVTQGDMPRFILDSYEECRGPPRLFMLDKFDVAGAGACLTRYSNPSFFKTESASSEIMESEFQREKRPRKINPKGSCLRNSEMTSSFLTPIMDYSQFSASEPVPGKFPSRLVKLKHRNLRISDISNRKSYIEGLINDVQEVLTGEAIDSSLFREEVLPKSPKVTDKFENEKSEGNFFLETSTLSGVTEKLHSASRIAKEEEILMGLGNEVDIHDFDVSSDESDVNHPPVQLAERNNLLDSGFITDVDHDSYRSDDIGSELENYVDALNMLETEVETDSESRGKSDPSFLNRQSRGIYPNINGHLDLQPQSSESDFIGSFDTLVYFEKEPYVMLSLPQSSNLVDLPHQQLQLRTIFEEASSSEIKINQDVTRKPEKAGECMELEPSACLIADGTCHQKQHDATMLVPISRNAFSSSCIADSALKPDGNFKAESFTTHSVEVISSSTSTPEFKEHVKSSFLPWKTNHVVVPPTFKESPDVLEEDNLLGSNEDRISATITDKIEYVLQEKAPAECSSVSSLTLRDDEIEKPLQTQEAEDKIDFISGDLLSGTPMGSIVQKSRDKSIDLEVEMQSEYSAMKTTSDYLEGFDDERKQLNSNMLFPSEIHELSLREHSGSYECTQTSENAVDDSAYISDERGSNHGRLESSMIGHQSSGYTEITSCDTASTFQMPESPQKSSFVEVSTVYVKDLLHDSKDNDTYSVNNPSPESSTFSVEIVPSNLQSESLAGEIRNISVTPEKFVHPQSPASSGNVDDFCCDATSSAISNEFEQFPFAEEQHESGKFGILEPLVSDSGEYSYATQLQPEVVELIQINGKDHVIGGLELADGSTKLDHQQELLVGESSKDSKSLDGYVITEDGIYDQVLKSLESAEVSTLDLLLIEDPLTKDDALHQVRLADERAAITRDSAFFASEKKSYFPLAQNKEQDMPTNSLTSQTSIPDLSDPFDTKLVDVNFDPHVKLYSNLKGDSICSRENKQYSDSVSENDVTLDHTDGKVLSVLQSSNLCSFDLQFQDPVSEVSTLNQLMSEIENLDVKIHDSISKNDIAEDGTDDQILSPLESSYAYSFDAHIQEDPVSDEASFYQSKPEIEELAITSDLTSLKPERKFFVPFSKNEGEGDHYSVVSCSQSPATYSSNLANATESDCNFDDILLEFHPCLFEETLICSREDKQVSYSEASKQHSQVDAERSELPSEQASVSEQSTVPVHIKVENMESSLDEDCSCHTIIQYSLENEVLITESMPGTFHNRGSNNEMDMSPSKDYVREEIEIDLSVPFQDVSEHPGSSMASEALAADFISPTGTQEPPRVLPGETISSLPLQEGIDEIPPLPPLPPIQWRIGKPPQGSLNSDEYVAQPVTETNPFIFPLNNHMDQHAGRFMLPTAFEENIQYVSPCIDAQMRNSSNLAELPQINLDQRKQLEIQFPENGRVHSSGFSLIVSSNEDGNQGHGNIAMERDNPFTLEARRPKLVKLLPGLELERSQEVPIIDTNAIAPFNSLMYMSTTGDGMYQYDYGDSGGYEGENLQYQNLSAPFPVAVHVFPHHGYHMFLNDGNSSGMYNTTLPEMEGDIPNGKHRSIRNRQRDPLIEAVAAHDKSTLRKVSELDRPMTKSKEDEPNYLLEQIKHKTFNLKPATSAKANILKAPSTNLKVAAILQKANAIRQACVGSDEEEEDDDDNWG